MENNLQTTGMFFLVVSQAVELFWIEIFVLINDAPKISLQMDPKTAELGMIPEDCRHSYSSAHSRDRCNWTLDPPEDLKLHKELCNH